jgi:molybdopterin/thiamine biosynthesis adenylyltransferase
MEYSSKYLERTKRNHFWFGGSQEQEKLQNLTVAIAGLGGMGSGIALALARLGVRKFHLADFDIVELSNLNRQVIANNETVGMSKLEATILELKKIDAEIEIRPFKEGVHATMVDDFLKGIDVIVDEIDVYPIEAHRVLHKAANKLNLPIYSSYVVGIGIHLYKFQGNSYTLDHFYSEKVNNKETLNVGLIETYFKPSPNYLKENEMANFLGELNKGAVPIFGASCLLGHSLVSIRLVFDWLFYQKVELPFGFEPTPIMPNFLKLDPIEFSFKVHNYVGLET